MGMSRTKGKGKSISEGAPTAPAPVKSRVSQNDGDPAEDETEKAECIDPVGHPDKSSVPGASKATTFWASPVRLASSAI
jgi:hypothetical protein